MGVCDEERMSCFTTFPGFGDELKRIDFVLVHLRSEDELEENDKAKDEADGKGEKNADLEDEKKSDGDFTPAESRKFFTDNLLAKGLHLKVVVSFSTL